MLDLLPGRPERRKPKATPCHLLVDMLLNLQGPTQIIESADYAAYVFDIHKIDFTAPAPTLRLSLVNIEGSGSRVDFSTAISGLTSFALREYLEPFQAKH